MPADFNHNLQNDVIGTMPIPTFGNRCLSAIGGGKQRSHLAGWVQLSAEVAPAPHGVPPRHPADENIDNAENLLE